MNVFAQGNLSSRLGNRLLCSIWPCTFSIWTMSHAKSFLGSASITSVAFASWASILMMSHALARSHTRCTTEMVRTSRYNELQQPMLIHQREGVVVCHVCTVNPRREMISQQATTAGSLCIPSGVFPTVNRQLSDSTTQHHITDALLRHVRQLSLAEHTKGELREEPGQRGTTFTLAFLHGSAPPLTTKFTSSPGVVIVFSMRGEQGGRSIKTNPWRVWSRANIRAPAVGSNFCDDHTTVRCFLVDSWPESGPDIPMMPGRLGHTEELSVPAPLLSSDLA